MLSIQISFVKWITVLFPVFHLTSNYSRKRWHPKSSKFYAFFCCWREKTKWTNKQNTKQQKLILHQLFKVNVFNKISWERLFWWYWCLWQWYWRLDAWFQKAGAVDSLLSTPQMGKLPHKNLNILSPFFLEIMCTAEIFHQQLSHPSLLLNVILVPLLSQCSAFSCMMWGKLLDLLFNKIQNFHGFHKQQLP